jgi:hypothetical protein
MWLYLSKGTRQEWEENFFFFRKSLVKNIEVELMTNIEQFFWYAHVVYIAI